MRVELPEVVDRRKDRYKMGEGIIIKQSKMFSDLLSEDSEYEEQSRIEVYKKHIKAFRKHNDIIKDFVISQSPFKEIK